MNNDLTKLSENEISIRQKDYIQASSALRSLYGEKKSLYNKLLNRRWVSPLKILDLKREMDNLEKASYLLNEYSMTLTDEMNTRSQNS